MEARVSETPRDVEARYLQMIRAVWLDYKTEMGMGESPERRLVLDDVRLFVERAAGFAGCELIRRVIGAAHVDDLELMLPGQKRDAAERAALKLGMLLVKTRSTGPTELAERIEMQHMLAVI